MNFLVDAQLPPALCVWLQSRGHQAEHVTSLGLGAASDLEIAEHAERAALIWSAKTKIL